MPGIFFYKGVKFNVISVTRGGCGSNSLEKALRNIWMAPYVYNMTDGYLLLSKVTHLHWGIPMYNSIYSCVIVNLHYPVQQLHSMYNHVCVNMYTLYFNLFIGPFLTF